MTALSRTPSEAEVSLAAINADEMLEEVAAYFEKHPEETRLRMEVALARVAVLGHDFSMALAKLAAVRPYFDGRADAEYEPDGGCRGNAEMEAMVHLDRAIAQVERLKGAVK